MRISVLAMAAALAACSGPSADNTSADGNPATRTADVNAAAVQAQGDIDTYAANTLEARPVTVRQAPNDAPSVGTVAEIPFAPDTVQGAATVVQTYFALIGERKYGQAWQLRDDGGRASGTTRRQFADSFAKYATYNAEVGAPGRIDAGAGQRYVQVPVRVYGTLAAGKRPFASRGEVTLHRTEIDGATPAQRSWRIRESSLDSQPAETAGAAAADPLESATARYNCAGTTRFSVRFDEIAETATIPREGRDVAVLRGQSPASGIWYRGGGYEVRGKGDSADYTAPGQPPVACTAN